MTRPLPVGFAALGALLALAGCPPELTGALCNKSSDCPAQQVCLVGHCGDESGTTGGATTSGGSSGGQTTGSGSTGGGDFRIDGDVTLNGGFPKPLLNPAWIWVWDHAPTSDQDTPQGIVQTDPGGTFRISSLRAGSYYLLAQYDIDRDGSQASSATDTLWLNPTAVTAVSGGDSKVTIDVPTFTCGVISLTDTTGTHISELIASVPSVHDATPITTAVVTANDPGTNSQVFSLTYKTATGSPVTDNQYSWTPDGGGFVSGIPALSGIYHFGVTVPQGDGYPAATCAVDHHPLGSMPSALTFLPAIMTVPPPPPRTVSWKLAQGTTEDDIYMQVQGMQGASGFATIPCFQQTHVTSPFAIPPSCLTPDAGAFFPTNLVVEVISFRTQYQPGLTPQAISIEGGISTGTRQLCEACP